MSQFLIPLAMGVPGLISGIMSAVAAGKQMRGGRLVRLAKRPIRRRRGRGIAADIAANLPLIGSFAGPLVRAMGGRLYRKKRVVHKRRGKGLAQMHIKVPIYHGRGLLGPGLMHKASPYSSVLLPKMTKSQQIIHLPYEVKRSYIGGLLAPSGHFGGAIRRGHYRHVNGKRVHVKAAIVHKGGAYKKPMRRVVRRRKY